MILDGILNFIEKENKERDFIFPFYEQYCFSNIPSTILNFFDIKTQKTNLLSKILEETTELEGTYKLILLIIDGFGFNQWLCYFKQNEFFSKLTKRGAVSPITSVFPSTTANAITTINSGLTPQEHGLPEWFVYFKEIDQIINTIHFKPIGSKQTDELLEQGVKPTILYDGKTIHQKLKKEKVKTFTFIDESIAHSAYSKLVFKGSTIKPAITISDLIVTLRKQLEKSKGPGYYYIYLDNLDSIAHRYGPHTEEYRTELTSISYLLQKELVEKLDQKTAKETLLLMTADHGQINIDPQKTIYLNKYKKLQQNFHKSSNNKSILPTGSPRDVFLHIKPDKIEEIRDFLSKELKEKAKIIETKDAINNGLFGTGKPKDEFLNRIGHLLILPHSDNTIWYNHPKGRMFNLLGFHGGLNSEEMLVPFVSAKISTLK